MSRHTKQKKTLSGYQPNTVYKLIASIATCTSVNSEQTMKEEKEDIYTRRDRTRNIYSTSNEQEKNAVFSPQQSVVQLLHLKGKDVQCHY